MLINQKHISTNDTIRAQISWLYCVVSINLQSNISYKICGCNKLTSNDSTSSFCNIKVEQGPKTFANILYYWNTGLVLLRFLQSPVAVLVRYCCGVSEPSSYNPFTDGADVIKTVCCQFAIKSLLCPYMYTTLQTKLLFIQKMCQYTTQFEYKCDQYRQMVYNMCCCALTTLDARERFFFKIVH